MLIVKQALDAECLVENIEEDGPGHDAEREVQERFSSMRYADKLKLVFRAAAAMYNQPMTFSTLARFLEGELRSALDFAASGRDSSSPHKIKGVLRFSDQESVQTLIPTIILSAPWETSLTRKRSSLVQWFKGVHEANTRELLPSSVQRLLHFITWAFDKVGYLFVPVSKRFILSW